MIFNKFQRKQAHEYIDKLFDLEKTINVDQIRNRRSLNQNAYAHGVVFTTFAIEMGWTVDEAKQYFKKTFLSYEKDGNTFVKETRNLDTKEMEIFLESCRVHASKEHKCYIPQPNEVTEEMLKELSYYDKYIK